MKGTVIKSREKSPLSTALGVPIYKIEKRCQEILCTLADGEEVKQKEDFDFLMTVFKNLIDWDCKAKGQKVIKIVKRTAPGLYGTKYRRSCFYIIREDNTETDVSFYACIRPCNKEKQVYMACRYISDEICDAFKMGHKYPVKSYISDKIIHSPKKARVHHHNLEFAPLFRKWVNEREGIDFLFQYINCTNDENDVTHFNNQMVIEDFKCFHNSNTELVLITEEEHDFIHHPKKG